MEFLLFDVSATGVFLVGYVAVVSLKRQRALPVLAAGSRALRPARRPARPTEQSPPRREWPRLSAPR